MTEPAPKAGVVGFPIAQSLSPKVHGYWLEKYGISGCYQACAIAPDSFHVEMTRLLRDEGWSGMNVTIPHKETAISFVDHLDDAASRLGAVNTVVKHCSGDIEGRNTDLFGFRTNLEYDAHWTSIKRRKAVVLGAGGAARAVVAAIQDWGFERICLANRSQQRAEALLASLDVKDADLSDNIHDPTLLDGADLVVNTTSLGMAGQPPLTLDLRALPVTAMVTDIVYKPLETDLLKAARLRGNPTVDGLGMLLYQAVPGFNAWFEPPMPPAVDADLRNHILGRVGTGA